MVPWAALLTWHWHVGISLPSTDPWSGQETYWIIVLLCNQGSEEFWGSLDQLVSIVFGWQWDWWFALGLGEILERHCLSWLCSRYLPMWPAKYEYVQAESLPSFRGVPCSDKQALAPVLSSPLTARCILTPTLLLPVSFSCNQFQICKHCHFGSSEFSLVIEPSLTTTIKVKHLSSTFYRRAMKTQRGEMTYPQPQAC